MLAVVFEKEGKFSLEDRPVPTITNNDDVLLRVLAASICGTDVHILASPPGHPATLGSILGHEYVAEVVEVGSSVKNVQVGDRVCVDTSLTCGMCSFCKMGMPNLCENYTTLGIFLDGGFTSYSIAPAKALYQISKDVPIEVAALAEPLSCVVNGSEKIKVQPGEKVVVLGAGPMGQLFTQVIKAAGAAKIISVDYSDYRLELAKESGATHSVNPKQENVKELVMKETGLGADIVIDCVGMLFDQAMTLVRPGGQILLVGMNSHAAPAIKQYDLTKYEITVKGTYISKFNFGKAVQIIESNTLKLEKLVTHRLPLREIGVGLEAMQKGEAMKVIVYPE
ncbi:alcohol dehydrogenase catalytic domain-containing protein [Paenibacillus alginolyticus]|uniref:zinc-binding dehydrogenase n=1 Tax=Paenibacillus alginolyticus TaxID=59839 RepID=UPI00040FC1D1|nr:alcohol dehydrogenase catalytic domain-containing protein [Paenibacillus alginolyticus]MCY9665797.1 alcohol dehydrogenase catalytic domain-containing protein [Paenibacillus alginolyticus]